MGASKKDEASGKLMLSLPPEEMRVVEKLRAKIEKDAGGVPIQKTGVVRAAIRAFAKQHGIA